MKKSIIAVLMALALWGCSSPNAGLSSLRVGTIAGPETQLMEVAKQVALEQSGLEIEIVTFADYILPNTALVDGSLDANVFQHQVYLDHYLKAHPKAQLVTVGKTFVYPVGIYSEKYTLETLPKEAKVAIPNDPSNGARALLLLEKAGLITLKHRDANSVTIADILTNPRELKIIPLDAAQLPRALPDVGLAVINTNYSLLAGLVPSKHALLLEDHESPYANIVVVRAGFENDPRVAQLVEALHAPAVLDKANELFQGQAIPAWR
ncbi:MAG: MetQ/NlpA family ABC transporter substrate-binding protein [Gammaproteobacteria bacterium]